MTTLHDPSRSTANSRPVPRSMAWKSRWAKQASISASLLEIRQPTTPRSRARPAAKRKRAPRQLRLKPKLPTNPDQRRTRMKPPPHRTARKRPQRPSATRRTRIRLPAKRRKTPRQTRTKPKLRMSPVQRRPRMKPPPHRTAKKRPRPTTMPRTRIRLPAKRRRTPRRLRTKPKLRMNLIQ